MDEFSLIEPFDIEGLAIGSQECFCLGVEFIQWRQRILDGKRFTDLCLANNAERLVRMAERHGRFAESRPTETPGWASVTVGGMKDD